MKNQIKKNRKKKKEIIYIEKPLMENIVNTADFPKNLKDLFHKKRIAEQSVDEFNRAMKKFARKYPNADPIFELDYRMDIIPGTPRDTREE